MSKCRNNDLEHEYEKVPVKENGIGDKSDIPDSYGYGVRHIQIFIGFLSLSVGYVARAHLGVTVVAMTNTLQTHSYNIPAHLHKNITINFEENTTAWEDKDYENETMFDDNFEIENGTDFLQKSKRSLLDSNNTSVSSVYRTYDWPKSTQEMVLGSFFLGYAIMMIPMGMVTQKFGGKLPIQIALLVNGVASIITPWMALWAEEQITQMVFRTMNMPHIIDHGSTFGTVVAFQAAGLLTAKGWPFTFWVTGLLCLSVFLIVTVFGAASPFEHKKISDMEKKFITGKANGEEEKKRKVPVKAVLRTKHVWASWCTHVGSSVSFVFFFSQAPTYIHYILDVDVKRSGLLSSVPYIASFFTTFIYGWVSDCLTNRNILSLTNARRVSNSYSQFGTAVCYIAVSYTKNVELAVFCLVMTMVFQSALHTGWMVNYIDLSPNFSGSIMSYGNTITCVAILGLPILVSCILTDVTNQLQWRIIFMAMAGLVTITNIVFVIFMSAETQPWNEDGYELTDDPEQNKDVKE